MEDKKKPIWMIVLILIAATAFATVLVMNVPEKMQAPFRTACYILLAVVSAYQAKRLKNKKNNENNNNENEEDKKN